MSKNITYQDMLVYADHDKSQCGLRIAIDHGLWITDDMILIEGKIPKKEKLINYVDKKMVTLFEEIQDERYFIIITPTWTKEVQSEKFIEDLKEKRQKK